MDLELIIFDVEKQITDYKCLYRDELITIGELIDLINNIMYDNKDVKNLDEKYKKKIDKLIHKTIVSIIKKSQ